ncbi:MAG: enoyl-CoA hydratase/isomerase family protein [Chloroflexi bacterium]|nr:enoyl-CoA hydratase/isomerase family protein [Chloroflexota bacterium]
MEYHDILYAKRDGVATVTINRPEVLNAFRLPTLREMIDAFEDASSDESIGVIVLTGAGGKAFCTGGDVGVEGQLTQATGRKFLRACQQLAYLMRNNGMPIIAAVRGYCIGGGNELNMLCDLTIATEGSRFGQAGPRMGSVPVWFGTQMLPRLVGEKRAREIVYLCWQYSAEEAYRMGWVNKVVPDDQLEQEVTHWCQELLDRSPQALRIAKTSLNSGSDMLWWSVIHDLQMLTMAYETEEFREGTRAFLEKRKPNFRKFPR